MSSYIDYINDQKSIAIPTEIQGCDTMESDKYLIRIKLLCVKTKQAGNL